MTRAKSHGRSLNSRNEIPEEGYSGAGDEGGQLGEGAHERNDGSSSKKRHGPFEIVENG